MRIELDQDLCKRFPELFVLRNSDPSESPMCWGFDCGDGWYNIVNQLCKLIQGHLKHREEGIAWAVEFNKNLAVAQANNWEGWQEGWSKKPRKVPNSIDPVVVTQVKEKYGTLRFYHNGGDQFISGVVSMAEAMSAVTCETCGNPGKTHSGPWIRTLCDEHAAKKNGQDTSI
jgi:hypothetical protein